MGCGSRMCYCCSCMGSDATSSPRVESVHHSSNGERMLNGNMNGNGNGEVLNKDEGGHPQLLPLKSNLKRPSRFSEQNGFGEREITNPTSIDGTRVTTSSVDGIRMEDSTTKPMDGNRESSNIGKPVDGIEEQYSVEEAGQEDFNANGRRKVQWTDAHGQDLAQVKEFEPSDSNHSDDEGRVNSDDACTCVIQ